MVSKLSGQLSVNTGAKDTPQNTHSYIIDMLEELSDMANDSKLGALARVLELARDAAKEMSAKQA
ncbi:hypothetical protein [Robiginitomaculum antarcticum]|uniref:hypothetical protein n=1 Tax=Robiginitomaculum antarcticum TaxID=437507 RepID=UPI0003797890|nr:hypothetical protein [Robiginitomaculum antarcticum]